MSSNCLFISFQTIAAEFFSTVLLRRKCPCHQDTDMGYPYSKSSADGHTKAYQTVTFLENPEKDWAKMLEGVRDVSPDTQLFD